MDYEIRALLVEGLDERSIGSKIYGAKHSCKIGEKQKELELFQRTYQRCVIEVYNDMRADLMEMRSRGFDRQKTGSMQWRIYLEAMNRADAFYVRHDSVLSYVERVLDHLEKNSKYKNALKKYMQRYRDITPKQSKAIPFRERSFRPRRSQRVVYG